MKKQNKVEILIENKTGLLQRISIDGKEIYGVINCCHTIREGGIDIVNIEFYTPDVTTTQEFGSDDACSLEKHAAAFLSMDVKETT